MDVKVGVPIMIDSYNLNESSFTYVLLSTYEEEGKEAVTVAFTMNGMLIKNRLVWMAYYLQYKDVNTIVTLKENSNQILSQLLEAN